MKDEYRGLMLAYTVDQFSARRLFQVTNTSAINSKGDPCNSGRLKLNGIFPSNHGKEGLGSVCSNAGRRVSGIAHHYALTMYH